MAPPRRSRCGVGAGVSPAAPRRAGVRAALDAAGAPHRRAGRVAALRGLPLSRSSGPARFGGRAQLVPPAGSGAKKRRKKEKRALNDEDVAVRRFTGPGSRGLGAPKRGPWRRGGLVRGALG